ncbi:MULTISPECIES: DUF6953 family protein [Pseudomonas]|uniref:DUF6953 family protein n=1 Tax=Pseudomonas TaxID=286 RepID=UPI00070DEA16|nr:MULTISPECIES: hypothetical protein [Pseudomonas]WIN05609.1 hypothetical protein QQF68_18620 [Pseudomonas syringae pv. antirrhini str. 126]
MDTTSIIHWMLSALERESCVYQDDVVDHLIKTRREDLLIENAEGNQVLGKKVLAGFRKLTAANVVWVKPGRYWRFRVAEDEPGRDARG